MPALRTRRGRRCDSEFPEIIAAATGLPDVILDPEIVDPGNDGAPDLAALRSRPGLSAEPARAAASTRPAISDAFDTIWHSGADLRGSALARRRDLLEALPLAGAVTLVETHLGQAQAVLDFARHPVSRRHRRETR